MDKPRWDTKIAIVLRGDLLSWQRLNVTAFLASVIAAHFPETMGKDFVDGSGIVYPGMFRQPVMIFQSDNLKGLYYKAKARNLAVSLYTKEIFQTQGDQNLAAIAAFKEGEHDYVGLVLYGKASDVDKVMQGIKLHP